MITAGKDASGHGFHVGTSSLPSAATIRLRPPRRKNSSGSDCRHAARQPIVAHCARVRARENGDGERSKEEQPRGQKAQGQQEKRSRVDRHCVQRARQTEARDGNSGSKK